MAAEARQRSEVDAGQVEGHATDGGSGARAEMPDTVWVETAEADEIRVHSLTAIRVEATEIATPKQEHTSDNPTPKDVGWGRLQGHRIQANQLIAHSVRARRIVADEIRARSFAPLQGGLRWTPAPDRGAIVNECVSALDGGASRECYRERPF